jgi:hypothetical protein
MQPNTRTNSIINIRWRKTCKDFRAGRWLTGTSHQIIEPADAKLLSNLILHNIWRNRLGAIYQRTNQ